MRKPASAPDTKNVVKFSRSLAVSVVVGVVLTFLILCAFAGYESTMRSANWP